MIKKIFLLTVLAISFVACKTETEKGKESDVSATETQMPETEMAQSKAKNGLFRTVKAANQEIEVYDIAGLKKLMNQKDDNIHVVNFWATWCTPCIKEMPYFEQVNAEMDDVNVHFVSIDEEEILESRVVPFVDKKELKSDVSLVVFDKDTDLINAVSDNWSGSIPATLIYNKHKSYFIEGSLTYDELVEEVNKFKS